MSEDRELVARAIAREPGAFAALVERHQKLVWHLVYRMVRHPDDTRDLSQEVFLKVHQRLHQFRFESALSTWIGRIAFSVAARHLERKRIPIVDLAGDDESGDAPLDRLGSDFDLEAACTNDDLQRQLRQALDGMPPLQRTLLTLYHLDELGVAEIAQVTRLPVGTVKNYLFRARRQLRDRFLTLTGESR
jgi:RNA polymerase sigma-70 factor (ECF subfamily)